MAEKLASLKKKGGGESTDELKFGIRIISASAFPQASFNLALLKKFKYIRTLTINEISDVFPSGIVAEFQQYPNRFFTTFNIGASSSQLTTTDMLTADIENIPSATDGTTIMISGTTTAQNCGAAFYLHN